MFTKKILILLLSVLFICSSSAFAKTNNEYSTIAYVEYNQFLVDISNADVEFIEQLLETKNQEKVIVFTTNISKNLENTIKEMKENGYKFQVKGYDSKKIDIKILNRVKHYLGDDFKVKEIVISKE